MLKTDYLGWTLLSVISDPHGKWTTTYTKDFKVVFGEDYKPESSVAHAQKQIKVLENENTTN